LVNSSQNSRDAVHCTGLLSYYYDFEKLIRKFMGQTVFKFDQRYELQTIKYNLRLLYEEKFMLSAEP